MLSPVTVASRPAEDALLKVWYFFATHPRTRALTIICTILTLCWGINVSAAQALDLESGNAGTYYLPLGGVTDSSDVPIAAYSTLPLDNGGVTAPIRGARSFAMSLLWAFYTMVIFIILSFVEFLLSFMWLEWLASPFILLANSLHTILGTFGILGLGIAATSIAIAISVIRGQRGTAVVEFIMVSIVVALIATPLGNPIGALTGDNGGIQKSAEYGNELGAATVSDAKGEERPGSDDTPTASAVNAGLVDMTLRSPVMLMSFGKELDGECENTWNEKAKAGETAEDLRKAVISCDPEAKAGNETDSGMIFGYYFMNWVGMTGLFSLVVIFAVFIIKDVMFALLGALNVIIKGYLAAFPMGSRYGFFNASFQTWINVLMVGIYIWALSTYLWVISEITSSVGVLPLMLSSTFMGIVVIIMAVSFFWMKRRGKKMGEAVARMLGRLGLSKDAPEGKQVPDSMKRAGSQAAKYGLKALFARKAITSAAVMAGTGGAAAGVIAAGTALGPGRPGPAALPPGKQTAPKTSLPVGSAQNTQPELTSQRTRDRGVPVGEPYAPQPGPTPASPAPGQPPQPDTPQHEAPTPAAAASQPTVTHTPMASPAAQPPLPTPPAVPSSPGAPTPTAPSSAAAPGAETATPTVTPQAPGQPSTPATAASSAPGGRYSGVWVHKNGTVTEVHHGEIVEGKLPDNVKAARSWGGRPADITSGNPPAMRRNLIRQAPSTFGTGGDRS